MWTSRLHHFARYLGRSTRSTKVPLEVYLEPTNRCNLQCASCPLSRMTRPVGTIDMALFRRIADQLDGCEVVNLYVYGEPLLHPSIDEMIGRLRARGVGTSLTSNGALLTEEAADRLIDAGLEHLIISIDTADEELYGQLRPGSDWTRVITGIRTIAERARSRGHRMVIHVSAVQTDRLLDTLPEFLAFVRSLPVDGQRFERFIDLSRDRELASAAPFPTAASRHTHFYLWRKLYVTWDGRAMVCPYHVYGGEDGLFVGDLRQETVAEVWNGPEMRERRRRALARESIMPACCGCGFPAYPSPAILIKTVVHERLFLTRIMPTLSTLLARREARDAAN